MIQPVYDYLFADQVRIIAYGASRNWSFAGSSTQEIEEKNCGITREVIRVMESCSVKEALVPKPAFNAQIAGSDELNIEMFPGFFRGVDADGVILDRSGQAYMLASADCLTTVMLDTDSKQVVAMHCGRDALIDRHAIQSDLKPRKYTSVIYKGFEKLNEKALVHPKNLRIFMAVGIGPETFTHPTTKTILGPEGVIVANKYQEANIRMIDFLLELDKGFGSSKNGHPIVTDIESGKIDLVALAKAQLFSIGVSSSQIERDGVDTATDKDEDGFFLFHSNRRDRIKRNLIVVKLL